MKLSISCTNLYQGWYDCYIVPQHKPIYVINKASFKGHTELRITGVSHNFSDQYMSPGWVYQDLSKCKECKWGLKAILARCKFQYTFQEFKA